MFTESRRNVVSGLTALTVLGVLPRPVAASPRTSVGGTLAFRVPWPVKSFDPHRTGDAGALLFGAGLFDSLYAFRDDGVVPALAEALPVASSRGTQVTLRQGVRFASGRPLAVRDVLASVARARRLSARPWLDALGSVRAASANELLFDDRDPDRVARLLASPLAAIVPDGFVAEHPDGTGAFEASHRGDVLVLRRNRYAALGPSFLDEITVAPAPDLGASLQAFESGEDGIGWLGLGLHEPRRGAVSFDAGVSGWAVLATGEQGGRWDLPGVAQRLADGIDPSRLASLGVVSTGASTADAGWGGPPTALLVQSEAPWLLELARAVAITLTQPGHEVTVRPVPEAELAAARATRNFALALDLVRPFDPSATGAALALTAASDVTSALELARHPPRSGSPVTPRILGRTLRVGVLAEIHAQGGHLPNLVLPRGPQGLDLGSIHYLALPVR